MSVAAASKKIVSRPVQQVTDQLRHLHPVLQRIYHSRGIKFSAELDHSLGNLPSPWLLTGIDAMTEKLAAAIRQQKKLLIVADFDADGATSCAVAMQGLKLLGAEQVDFIVPCRFQYGYGLTPEIVALLKQRQPEVLLTVDNGISSIEGVRLAKSLGLTVLITDHHLPGDEPPEADAIVNPNLPEDRFPGGALAGVGVIFYILMVLRSRLREQGWFEEMQVSEPNLGQLLDYVALGTVADVVPLDYTNRILVQQGLLRIRAGRCHPGIKALIEVASRNQAAMTTADLGFALAPRLNAAGRLENMALGIQCLLADDAQEAMRFARKLDDLNRERREIEGQMKVEALSLLDTMQVLDDKHVSAGVCLYDENWHQGVIGILASRIKDRLHRPVIAFAPADNGEIKGSARSIPGVHIRDVLSDIAAAHPKILQKFGGHAMAAGLALEMHDYPAFALAFDEMVGRQLRHIDLEQKVVTDGELSAQDITLQFAELLRQAGPWGQEFPEPAFDGVFDVVQSRIVGQHHLKLVLRLPFDDLLIDAIAFHLEGVEEWLGVRQIRAAYQLDVNEYQGRRSVQLILQYLEKIS